VPARTVLIHLPDLTTTSDGQEIDDVWVDGGIIQVANNDVTIKRCLVTGNGYWLIRQLPGTSGLTIQDCEIYPKVQGTVADYGIDLEGGRATITRVNIHNVTSGVHVLASDVTIRDSYLHEFVNISGSDHNDGVLIPGTYHNIVVDHNTIFVPTQQTSPLALYDERGGNDGVTVSHNLLAGGGYATYGGSTGTNIHYLDNRFSRIYFRDGGYWGPVTGFSRTNPGNQWSGNIWDDTGTLAQ
jgi:hypothetical protein